MQFRNIQTSFSQNATALIFFARVEESWRLLLLCHVQNSGKEAQTRHLWITAKANCLFSCVCEGGQALPLLRSLVDLSLFYSPASLQKTMQLFFFFPRKSYISVCANLPAWGINKKQLTESGLLPCICTFAPVRSKKYSVVFDQCSNQKNSEGQQLLSLFSTRTYGFSTAMCWHVLWQLGCGTPLFPILLSPPLFFISLIL